jgi:type I restriction enzyme S subunit
MQSHFYINRLEEQLQGVNIPFINKGRLLETPISIPSSIEEMERIVEKVNSKLDSIDRIENEIEVQLKKAEKNKQSILASAFSGRIL